MGQTTLLFAAKPYKLKMGKYLGQKPFFLNKKKIILWIAAARDHYRTVINNGNCYLDCLDSTVNSYLIAFQMSATNIQPYARAAAMAEKKKKKKTTSRQRWGNCYCQGTCFSFYYKKKSFLYSSPLQPPHIMGLCWCHIDYADRKLPLFVPWCLLSVIALEKWAQVTLKAMPTVFPAFSARAAVTAPVPLEDWVTPALTHPPTLIAF